MKLLKEKLSLIIILFIILIFSISWSLLLPINNWPTDYGHHFYISMTNSGKSLYKDFFTHKGPILVLFIDFFQYFLGTSWRSSIGVLISLTLFFFTIVNFASYKYSKNYIITLIAILYTIFFFRYQSSDVFVDLINVPLILLANLFLLNAINRNKKEYLYLFSFFISLSFLSRVDTLIYILASLIFLIIFILKEKKFYFFKTFFLLKNISIFFITFFLLSLSYKFNFIEFFNQNIFFNIIYASDDYKKFTNLGSLFALMPYKHYAYILIIKFIFFLKLNKEIGRKNSIIFAVFTLLQFLIFLQKYEDIYLFLGIFCIEIFFILYLIITNRYRNYELLFILLVNFSSFFIYLYSGSYKLNHSFILIPGTLMFLLFFLKNIFNEKSFYKNMIYVILILLFLHQSEKIYRYIYYSLTQSDSISLNNKFSNYFYNHNLIEQNDLVKVINLSNPPIICGRGWLHIFSSTESRGLMFDWWMYDDRKKIKFSKYEEYFNNLVERKFGKFFLINSECVNNKIFSNNKYINKLLKNSDKIEVLTHLNKVSYHYRKFK